MISTFLAPLAAWGELDTWIVITAALAAMACALPGNYLVLRRQSMMGDALSHAVLPGIAVAFLVTHGLRSSGMISGETYSAIRHVAMLGGAIGTGVLTALLTEAVKKWGGVESSAALGVVFTSLFALGVILIRMAADHVDLDANCVLYGNIEGVIPEPFGPLYVPREALVNGGMLVVNLILVAVFFKELRLSAFDPALATALGINATLMHYCLMAVTATTLVAAFESVGSILVIAMLIVPPATAYLLTNRLGTMIALSLVIACLSAVLGHVAAITVPPAVFSRLGFDTVVDASTAGTIAVAAGCLFAVVLVFSPKQGMVNTAVRRGLLNLRIACEDVLGLLYRMEEMRLAGDSDEIGKMLHKARGIGWLTKRLALFRLIRSRQVIAEPAGYRLTQTGRQAAQSLVRSHRLWEAYLEKHFELPHDRQHRSAHLIEHFIGGKLQEKLADELSKPDRDPHGRAIPPSPSDD